MLWDQDFLSHEVAVKDHKSKEKDIDIELLLQIAKFKWIHRQRDQPIHNLPYLYNNEISIQFGKTRRTQTAISKDIIRVQK